MKINFDITADEFHLIQNVLLKYLDNKCKVWVFGSRAKNKARFNSDLDLAIECEAKLPKETILSLKEDFDDAQITFSVDIVELNAVEDYFKKIINNQKILFPMKSKIPFLRFPEFSGEWESKTLGELSNGIMSGKTKTNEYGEYIVYGSTGIIGKCQQYTHNGEYILIARVGANAGLINIVSGKFSVTDNTLIFDSKNSVVVIFIYFLLLKSNLNKLVFGTGQPLITGGQLKALKVFIPLLPEQQKIADFLTQIDNKINQLAKKKQLLERYKKGVMQQIFSQEIRFTDDDGREFPEWEEKSLNETLDIVIDNRGKTPPVENSGYPLLEVNAIGNKKINYKAVSKFVNDESYRNWFRKHLKNGDVLFSTVGGTAQCSFYEEEFIAVIAQNIVGLRFKENYISLFMFYLITEDKNNSKFKKIEMTAVQPSIKVSQMIHLLFDFPCFDEQTKIANFLTALDEKIALVEKQHHGTKQYKKGLLQQLFV